MELHNGKYLSLSSAHDSFMLPCRSRYMYTLDPDTIREQEGLILRREANISTLDFFHGSVASVSFGAFLHIPPKFVQFNPFSPIMFKGMSQTVEMMAVVNTLSDMVRNYDKADTTNADHMTRREQIKRKKWIAALARKAKIYTIPLIREMCAMANQEYLLEARRYSIEKRLSMYEAFCLNEKIYQLSKISPFMAITIAHRQLSGDDVEQLVSMPLKKLADQLGWNRNVLDIKKPYVAESAVRFSRYVDDAIGGDRNEWARVLANAPKKHGRKQHEYWSTLIPSLYVRIHSISIRNWAFKNMKSLSEHPDMIDWLDSCDHDNEALPEDMRWDRTLTFESALDRSIRWHGQRLEIYWGRKPEFEPDHVLCDPWFTEKKILKGKLTVLPLITPKMLIEESVLMNHCVGYGGYDRSISTGYCQIFSLRDNEGEPVATMEVLKGSGEYRIAQLRGHSNSCVPSGIESAVKRLISSLNKEV